MGGIFKEGYFTEEPPLWPGRALSVKILEPLASEETDHQLVEVFRGEGFGLILALDGKIQLAESDEFMYHEMFAHVAAYAHEDPEEILVIGGGDGGLVRELLKHPCVERIDVCDYDEELVELCRKHLPWTRQALADSRVELFFEDASAFIKTRPGTYDLILIDGPDPVGEGEVLHSEQFLNDCKRALKPEGVLAAQAGSYILHTETTLRETRLFEKLFRNSGYFSFTVPSFPGGTAGVCIGCDEHPVDRPVRMPFRRFVHRLKAYSAEMHKAAFVLPPFWKKLLECEEDETE